MRKLMLIIVLFSIGIMVNAQEKEPLKNPKQDEQKFQQPDAKRVMVTESQLLQPIKDHILMTFTGAKIEKAWRLESATGVVTYKVLIKNDINEEWNLLYDSNGKFVSKSGVSTMGKDKSNNPPDY